MARRRFCVLLTRFLRSNIGCGGPAPAMRSLLSPMIAAMRALKSSTVFESRLHLIKAAMIFARADFVNVHGMPQLVGFIACLDHSSSIGSRSNLGGLAVCCC